MNKTTWMALGAIVVLALVLDLWFYTGYLASDDIGYLEGARRLLGDPAKISPEDVLADMTTARLALTIPNGVVYGLSGGSVAAVAWFQLVYHVGLVALAFVLGRMIRDRNTGLVAALLAAINPLYYVFAGAILPDNATAFWLGVVMVILESMRRKARVSGSEPGASGPGGSPGGAGGPARTAPLMYLLAGLVLGLAYSCKETALIMTVPAAVWVIRAAPRLRDPIWIRDGAFLAAGLAVFLVLEVVILRLVLDDWTWRLGMVTDAGDVYVERMSVQGVTPLERFGYAYERRLEPYIPITVWVLLIAVVGHGLTRGRNIGLMGFFWWPLFYITIGSTSFTAYLPPSLQTRYYSIVVLPAVVMTAAFVVSVTQWWRRWHGVVPRPVRWSLRWPGEQPARRMLATAPAIVVGLGLTVGFFHELDRNAPRAGNIYRATHVRSFVAAYEWARDQHPSRPIVLSEFNRRWLTPVFFPRAPQNVHAHPAVTPGSLPEPPYLYLERTGREPGAGLPGGDAGRDFRLLEVIYAPATRGEALQHGLHRLVFTMPRTPPWPARRRGTAIYLVTASSLAPPGR